jgi:hypothetical protein
LIEVSDQGIIRDDDVEVLGKNLLAGVIDGVADVHLAVFESIEASF